MNHPAQEGNGAPLAVFDIDTVDAEQAALIGDALWSGGVQAIEEFEEGFGIIRLRSSFGLGFEETDSRLHLVLGSFTDVTWQMHAADPRVFDTWKEFAGPIRVTSELEIRPAWLDEVDADTRVRTIAIDPGGTFGLGDHPTTLGSLRMMLRFLDDGMNVLDVGCGSGILGICALVHGARSAVGIDINPASVHVSLSNARANSVEDRWTALLDPLEDLDARFDLVTANILAPVLVALSADLRRVLDANGTLIISGVLSDRHEHVLEALDPLHVVDTIDIDGWATLALRHQSTRESISSR